MGGKPLALAIPKHKGNAIKKTIKPELASANRFFLKLVSFELIMINYYSNLLKKYNFSAFTIKANKYTKK